jgi:predicted transcriptional regulator
MVEEADEDDYYLTHYPFDKCQTTRTGKFEKADVVAALVATRGNLAACGRLLKKTRHEVSKYVDADQELRLLMVDQKESFLDEIEQKAINSALTGDTTNQRFFLQTLGKNRGYTTKTETDMRHGVDPSLTAMLERVAKVGNKIVSREESLEAFIEEMDKARDADPDV